MATAALVLGILGPIVGGAVLAIILGIVALVQIRKTGELGRGRAIAGVAIGTAWVVLVGVFLVIALVKAPATPETPSAGPGPERSVATTDLKVGDCVNGVKEGRVAELPTVPCAQPHEAEVFATFNITGGRTYPGESTVTAQAEKGCVDRLPGYSASAVKDPALSVVYLYPTTATWLLNDRTITCFVHDAAKKRTGSVKG